MSSSSFSLVYFQEATRNKLARFSSYHLCSIFHLIDLDVQTIIRQCLTSAMFLDDMKNGGHFIYQIDERIVCKSYYNVPQTLYLILIPASQTKATNFSNNSMHIRNRYCIIQQTCEYHLYNDYWTDDFISEHPGSVGSLYNGWFRCDWSLPNTFG